VGGRRHPCGCSIGRGLSQPSNLLSILLSDASLVFRMKVIQLFGSDASLEALVDPMIRPDSMRSDGQDSVLLVNTRLTQIGNVNLPEGHTRK
jgi:hypothetical protein